MPSSGSSSAGRRCEVANSFDTICVALQAHKGLPALIGIWADRGHQTARVTTDGYESVRVWSLACGGPAEPDRQIVGAEGLVFYTATGFLPESGWHVHVQAKATVPAGLALNDDIVDALELVGGRP